MTWKYALAVVAGAWVALFIESAMERFGSPERWRRKVEKIAKARGWQWLGDRAEAGQWKARAERAESQCAMLGSAIESLKTLTHHDALLFGPDGSGERCLRVDTDESEDGTFPVLIVVGASPGWKVFPLADLRVSEVIEALGEPDEREIDATAPLAVLLASASNRELRRLPGSLRTGLIHAMLSDHEIPGVVEGLSGRHAQAKAVSA